MFDTVVVATDGSESVKRAVDVALDLAGRFGAEVHALSVVDASEVDASPEQLREELRTALETTADAALATVEDRTDQQVITAVRQGRPANEICEYAREVDADLVATGTRGRHGENRLLLGSVAERVVRTSPVPVLTVRQLEPADEANVDA
ncbi:universal stress protein [Natrarchaeobaculum sulfurireducens]|uniref:Nucleotide-binding protein, UspA family n=1 Tax=Natrarchaeobaculum sulfurireducens TaxID=2044521 RepID=A0A346PAL9_9EURY|nr:universal stress protein [Natrarchaeobaculum sulfurireducens]AXR76564.1 Nucleotide-binding protein, UspA family [Natrarchaeobaculum sulfurireducens]AXR80241.1 Universal stress protein [Natrarchaeobaculum sulfurireducens]